MPGLLHALVQPIFETAIEDGQVGKARFALLLGADPNASLTTPALNRMAVAGNLPMVQVLIKAKANLNAADTEGDTPLLCALRGADVKTPATNKKAAKPILEGTATAKAKAWTPASDQAAGKKLADKTTTWVLDDGGNIADKGGLRGARKLPAQAGDIVDALIAAGANVNASNTGGTTYRLTPLMLAVQWGNPAIVKALVRAKANVNAHDSDGETVLMYAAAEGVADIMTPLLAAGAKVNAQNSGGFTALHAAAQYNRPTAITILLAAGADLNIKNHKDMSPIDIAVAMRSVAAAKAIVAATKGVHADPTNGAKLAAPTLQSPGPRPGAGPQPNRPGG
jgi:ankyrin repeat protein